MSASQLADDAKKVDQAVECILNDDPSVAMDLLSEVLQNAPTQCPRVVEDAEGIQIRFWSQSEFLFYVGTLNPQQSITWTPNAYARAFYYLGFLWVKLGRFETAIEALDRGLVFESHPLLLCEKAKALSSLKLHEDALRLYKQAAALPPDVVLMYLAPALRGQGVQLIDLGDLDAAEAIFVASLRLDPDSEVARNELLYIGDLREGVQHSGATETVRTEFSTSTACSRCGRYAGKRDGDLGPEAGGAFMNYVCERCAARPPKRWWEFWK